MPGMVRIGTEVWWLRVQDMGVTRGQAGGGSATVVEVEWDTRWWKSRIDTVGMRQSLIHILR